MASISFLIKNQAKIARAWKQAPAEMGKAIAEIIQTSGTFVTGKVKEHIRAGTDMWKSPIDTGAMRQGIQPVFEKAMAIIRPSSATPYAVFVHEGTKTMRARPFFEITKRHEEKNVAKIAQQRINQFLKKLKV